MQNDIRVMLRKIWTKTGMFPKLHVFASLLASIILTWSPAIWALDPITVPDVDLTLMPGTYTRMMGKVQHVLTFHADRTFQGKSFLNGRLDDEYEGRWQARREFVGDAR